MTLLAFDTTLDVCSVALLSPAEEVVLAERHVSMSRGHAEALHGLIAEAMSQADVTFADLSGIAVTTGPGTFTGSRVGIAAARGFALTLDIPLVGISTLQALAVNADEFCHEPIVAAHDARRGQVYIGVYSSNIDELSAPCAVNLEDVQNVVPTGPFWTIGSAGSMICDVVPDAKQALVEQLPRASRWGFYAASFPVPAEVPLPLYLRPPDAKPPAKGSQIARVTPR